MDRRLSELLRAREVARSRGDVTLERAINADLTRLGYLEEPGREYGASETTKAAQPERAVPSKPKPREAA